ncbi:MAG TPA: SRPBCC family protein [Candidatus Thermoplasmatota archaeon]|nr:SRPBCC family protein [Candidatus Thermoplasmatota archaeon]
MARLSEATKPTLRDARAMEPLPPHGRMTLRRRFPHPPAAAYAWLTDFDEQDAERAGGAVVGERRVVLRERDRVVVEGVLEVAGRRIPARAEVALLPPDRWRAHIRHARGSLVTFNEYHVASDGAGGTVLEVRYHFALSTLRHRLRYWLGGRSILRRELEAMWDGFEAAMARELAVPA